MKIYIVKHEYSTDRDFGDAILQEDTVAAFTNKASAEKFVERWSNSHVYDRPYDELYIEEMEVVNNEDEVCPVDPWWIENEEE